MLLVKLHNKILPQYINAKIGDQIEFICNSDMPVEWFYNGGPLPKNAINGSLSRKSTHWLRIPYVKKTDSGNYICHGQNNKVSFWDQGELVVSGKLIMTYITLSCNKNDALSVRDVPKRDELSGNSLVIMS